MVVSKQDVLKTKILCTFAPQYSRWVIYPNMNNLNNIRTRLSKLGGDPRRYIRQAHKGKVATHQS